MKTSFSRLELKAFVGLLFMYKFISLFLTMVILCSSGNI